MVLQLHQPADRIGLEMGDCRPRPVFGLVGWTVAVPTLLGLALGVFIDNRVESSVSFTITFLIVGVAVGVSMAWYWIRQESRGDDEP